MIRLFDIIFSFLGLVCGLPILLVIWVLGIVDTGSPIFRQERVGRSMKSFTLVKFRTMSKETASVASHLASSSSITSFGGFLRKTKLDELPQLWNILKGDMSLVGPRPSLVTQVELIDRRRSMGALKCRPGLTGLAQVNSYDGMSIDDKSELDAMYAKNISAWNDLKIFLRTFQYLLKPPPVY